jgi:hypothetical protein
MLIDVSGMSHGMWYCGWDGVVMIGDTSRLFEFDDVALLMNAFVMDNFHFNQHRSGGFIWLGYVIDVVLVVVPFNAQLHIDMLLGVVMSDNIVTFKYSRHAFISYISLFVM